MIWEAQTQSRVEARNGSPAQVHFLKFAANHRKRLACVVTFLMPSACESYRWAVSREFRFLGQKGQPRGRPRVVQIDWN